MILLLHVGGKVTQVIHDAIVVDGIIHDLHTLRPLGQVTGEYAYVPDQPLDHVFRNGPGIIEARYPEDFKLFTPEEVGQIIDRVTGILINRRVHPYAGLEEQIGILRKQIAEILAAINLRPIASFDMLENIANDQIQRAAELQQALSIDTKPPANSGDTPEMI